MTDIPDFMVRKGRLSDAEEATKLWKKLHTLHIDYFKEDFAITKDAPAFHKKWWATCTRSRTKCTYVAEHNGVVIGYLMGAIEKRPPVLKIGKEAICWDLFVEDDYRGIGVGAALMEEFFSWARQKKVNMVTLQVAPPNKMGKKFYKKLGFESILHTERKMIK